MSKFRKLTARKEKIAYVQETVPRETLIKYQNRLAQEISSEFSPNAFVRQGHWGRDKNPGTIMFEKYDDNHYTVSVIDSEGTHISSYSSDKRGLKKLIVNQWWIWSGQPHKLRPEPSANKNQEL